MLIFASQQIQLEGLSVEEEFMRSLLTYACEFYVSSTSKSSDTPCRLVEIGAVRWLREYNFQHAFVDRATTLRIIGAHACT
jgi:hypothetical protein